MCGPILGQIWDKLMHITIGYREATGLPHSLNTGIHGEQSQLCQAMNGTEACDGLVDDGILPVPLHTVGCQIFRVECDGGQVWASRAPDAVVLQLARSSR